MLEIVIGFAVGASAVGAFRLWLSAHKWRTIRQEFYRSQFFDAAEALLRSDTLDEEKLVRLKFLIHQMDKPDEFGKWVETIKAVNSELRAGKHIVAKGIVSVDWAQSLYWYILAVSYSRSIRGIILRARLTGVLSPGEAASNTDVIDRRVHSAPFQMA